MGEALPACPCCRQPWLSAPKIHLSLDTYCAVINGAVIQFSPHEAAVLSALLKYSPGTATVGALVRHVWGNDAPPERLLPTLKVHLSHMRRKLAGSGFFIHSVWGLGYQLNDWEEPA